MTKSRTLRRAGAVVLSLAMAATTVFAGGVDSKAASKVKLSSTSKTFAAKGGTATVKIKGATSAKISSTTVKSSKASVATVKKSSKVKFKVTAKKNTATKKKTATITAKVKIAKKYQKKYTKKSYSLKYKVTVKAAAAVIKVTGVTLDNTTPKVGDVITASPDPADASNVASYKWIRSDGTAEKVIPGETSASYTVQAVDVGYFLYAEITDKDGNKFQSKVTSRILGQAVTGLTITGMSGKSDSVLKANDIPLVGDTLTANVAPEGAKGLVTFQWYRGTSAIVGATSDSYTVTADDVGNTIKVVISAIDKEAVDLTKASSAETTQNVMVDVSKLTATLNKTAPKNGETVKVTVKNGETTLTNQVGFQWYRDEVKDENKIVGDTTASHDVVPADYAKKLVVKATGDQTKNYYGEITASTEAIKQTLDTMTVKSELGGAALTGTVAYNDSADETTFAVGQTLVASFTDDKTTATYTWEVDGKTVATTTNKYTITAADIGLASGEASKANINFVVTATGSGNYTGEETVKFKLTKIDAKAEITGIKVKKNGQDFTTGGTAAVGDVLTVEALPNAATSKLEYKWITQANTEATTAIEGSAPVFTGASYTVSADDAGKAIYVQAKYTADPNDQWAVATTTYYGTSDSTSASTTYADNAGMVRILAKKALTSMAITTDNNETGNKLATGYKELAVEVGAWAHAAITPSLGDSGVSYQWYKDEAKSGNECSGQGYNTKNYLIDKTDLGHALVCKATATASGYENSTVSATTVAVAPSSLTIKSIAVVEAAGATTSSAAVNKLTAGVDYTIVATLSDDTKVLGSTINTTAAGTITWNASGRTKVEKGATFTAKAGDKIVEVTVAPDGKQLTGDNAVFTFTTEVGSGDVPVVGDGIIADAGYVSNGNTGLTALINVYDELKVRLGTITDAGNGKILYVVSDGLTNGATYTIKFKVTDTNGAFLYAENDSFTAKGAQGIMYCTPDFNGDYATGVQATDVVTATLCDAQGTILSEKTFTFA